MNPEKDTFGPKAKKKKPKLQSLTYESMAQTFEDEEKNFIEKKGSIIDEEAQVRNIEYLCIKKENDAKKAKR